MSPAHRILESPAPHLARGFFFGATTNRRGGSPFGRLRASSLTAPTESWVPVVLHLIPAIFDLKSAISNVKGTVPNAQKKDLVVSDCFATLRWLAMTCFVLGGGGIGISFFAVPRGEADSSSPSRASQNDRCYFVTLSASEESACARLIII